MPSFRAVYHRCRRAVDRGNSHAGSGNVVSGRLPGGPRRDARRHARETILRNRACSSSTPPMRTRTRARERLPAHHRDHERSISADAGGLLPVQPGARASGEAGRRRPQCARRRRRRRACRGSGVRRSAREVHRPGRPPGRCRSPDHAGPARSPPRLLGDTDSVRSEHDARPAHRVEATGDPEAPPVERGGPQLDDDRHRPRRELRAVPEGKRLLHLLGHERAQGTSLHGRGIEQESRCVTMRRSGENHRTRTLRVTPAPAASPRTLEWRT